MIDTHCHLTYDGLHERVDRVLADAAAAGVDRVISVGTTPADAERARALSHRIPSVYFAAGLHPHYAEQYRDKAALLDALREKLADDKCVALGEMGLDRHYPDPPFDVQRRAFEWQLELTADGTFDGPIVIHNREATDDTLAVLRDCGVAPERFVFHCFTGSAHELDAILAFGAKVSFTGIVTFNSAKALARASDRVPIDRLMIETDSPYLTPEPYRKVRPNEPRYVADVARFLAERRGMTLDEFTAAVDANAERFFGLAKEGDG
ncbi:MAG: TatD family hydrolase [Phycisphaeraceae bacterium]